MPRHHRTLVYALGVLAALAFAAQAMAVASAASTSSTTTATEARDPWIRPFASTSIWNMPIGSGAKYVDSGYPLYTRGGTDVGLFVKTKPSDPVLDMRKPYAWRDRCNTSSTKISGRLSVPADLYVEDAYQHPDGHWVTRNTNGVILQPDGRTLANVSAVCRDEVPGPIYGHYPVTTDIYGDGIKGGHGASGMSSFGGALRAGELVSDAPIEHVLDLTLYAEHAYIAGSDTSTCYVWPASRCDSYAADGRYNGTNPNFRIGALLAIPPTVTPADLGISSPVGKKVFAALRDYGGYFTEDSAWGANKIKIDRSATEDIQAFNTTQVREEFGRMIAAAKVVANNGPESIGGGGTPRRPLHPELVPPGEEPTSTTTTTTTAADPTTTTTVPTGSQDPELLVADSFGRAAGPLGRAETGQAWSNDGLKYAVVDGRAAVSGGGGEGVALVDAGVSDGVVSATVSLPANASPGLSVRASDKHNQLLVSIARSSRDIELFKVVAGKYTKLADAGAGLAAGGSYRLDVVLDGPSVEVLVDDRSVLRHALSAADHSTFGSRTSMGLRMYRKPGTGDDHARWDDFTVTTTR